MTTPEERAFLDEEERVHDRKNAEPFLRLVTASTITMTRAEWMWDQRIPLDAASLIAGREGKGKSALVCHLTGRVTRGQLDGDLFGIASDVVFVGTEDHWSSVLVPRLVAAGADLDRVHLVEMDDGIMFSVDAHVDLLRERLATLDRPVAMIVIDPLDAHLGSQVDTHRKAEVQRTIARLGELAQEYHAAVVGIAHLNKGSGVEVLQRVIGSVGFTTAVRSVIGVADHPDRADGCRIAVVAKSNLTSVVDVPAWLFRVEAADLPAPDGGKPFTTARVAELGEEMIDASALVAGGLDHQERTERDDAVEFLEDYLADGPKSRKDVLAAADAAGHKERTVRRAFKKLNGISERAAEKDGRASWSLPKAADQ